VKTSTTTHLGLGKREEVKDTTTRLKSEPMSRRKRKRMDLGRGHIKKRKKETKGGKDKATLTEGKKW